jgi:hypothetical protein
MNTEAQSGVEPNAQRMPFGQRLFDNWPLLMIAGILIMALVYTGWGLWEIATMPAAELP